MEVRELKALLALMHEHGLVELEVEDKKGKVRLVRGVVGLHNQNPTQAAVAVAPSKAAPGVSPAPGKKKIQGKATAFAVGEAPPGTVELGPDQKLVESPMVGTFYRAPSPTRRRLSKRGRMSARASRYASSRR